MPPPFSFSCAEPLPSPPRFLHALPEKRECGLDHKPRSLSTRRVIS
jgi:hypothetical protein